MRISTYDGFINEGVNDWSFKTTVGTKSIDVVGFEGKTDEQWVVFGELSVEWELDIDARDRGIKSFGISVNKISGHYTVYTPTDTKDEEEQVEFSVKGTEWEIKSEMDEFRLGGGIAPSTIDIDLKTKKITVSF